MSTCMQPIGRAMQSGFVGCRMLGFGKLYVKIVESLQFLLGTILHRRNRGGGGVS